VVDHVSLNLFGSIPGTPNGRFADARVANERLAAERLEPGGALEPVATRARRRAVRAGDAEVDTGHLLHALLESDERALGLVAQLPTQTTRLMGYLAQRSIGFGRDWRPGEGAGISPADLSAPPGWSRSAAAALGRAELAALLRDGGEPDPLDLLAELVADPASRAAEVLLGAGVDLRTAAERVRTARTVPEPDDADERCDAR
jgi:hypothetical protein